VTAGDRAGETTKSCSYNDDAFHLDSGRIELKQAQFVFIVTVTVIVTKQYSTRLSCNKNFLGSGNAGFLQDFLPTK
jgi:hypothetical protein